MNKEEQIKFQCWFTPWKIVIGDLKLMNVNWQDTTRTWLENSCGPGISLYVLKRIYMFTLRKIIPDPQKREEHILENMLFGCDILIENIKEAKLKLNIHKNGPGDKNLVVADSTKYSLDFGRKKRPISFGPNSLFEVQE
jgi:hypothetical protein|tara:strand:+ start:3747 stop:4163 length:417 start_codon:yes stop_codon:yes gene_type:complete